MRPSVRLTLSEACGHRHWAARRGPTPPTPVSNPPGPTAAISPSTTGATRRARVGRSRQAARGRRVPPGPPCGRSRQAAGAARSTRMPSGQPRHTTDAEAQTPAVRSPRRPSWCCCWWSAVSTSCSSRDNGNGDSTAARANPAPRRKPGGSRSRMRALRARRWRPRRPTARSGSSAGSEATAPSADGTRAMTLPSTAGRAATIYRFRFSMRWR